MARNTGRGSRAGRLTGTFLWAKTHGGYLGRVPLLCRLLGNRCPHMTQPARTPEPSGSGSSRAVEDAP